MKKINIAIDGVAGSGKSTVAKIVASRLGYNYIDTGSMYRCVAYLVIKNNINPSDLEQLEKVLSHYDYQKKGDKFYLNGEDVTLKIRTNEVNAMLANVVALPYVRSFLVKKQQEMGRNKGVIMDGRDIGSVVLKDAELKIYQTADLDVRAQRRYKENLEKGIQCDYNQVLANLKKRDYTDINVSKALVRVSDAIYLDTSKMTIEEVVNYILKLVEMKVK